MLEKSSKFQVNEETRRQQLLSKPVLELVDMIIQLERENAVAKTYRRRLMQIRNLVLDPEERRSPGRPPKTAQD